MTRRIALGVTLVLVAFGSLRTTPVAATAPTRSGSARTTATRTWRASPAPEPASTPVSIRTDPPGTTDPHPDPDDPEVHDPVEAARSDRSIGSWLLVAGAFVAAAAGIGVVLAHTRERRR